jgi:glycine dehydrogenase subunit 1
VQWPDFFGQLDDLRGLGAVCRNAGVLFVVAADPIALGLFEPPGSFGADIVVADGQCLGLPPSFGGPSLGIFATRKDLVRRLAGRLVGQTADAHGRRGFVLTLGTREQHIRRAKATSNICTNAALGALAASVYLATLGQRGLKRVAELCYQKSHYAAAQIAKLPRVQVNPGSRDRPFFKEFVVSLPRPVAEVNEILLSEHNIIGGYALEHDYPQLENQMLIAVTETAEKADIDRLVKALEAATA